MKLFVCMLLVTMVVAAMLIDDSGAGAPRRRSSRRRYVDGQAAVMEVVEEARELLDDLADLQEDVKAEQMMELEDLGQEEDDSSETYWYKEDVPISTLAKPLTRRILHYKYSNGNIVALMVSDKDN
uniref:Uncharacterized protein n=1 Tax=Branchiostoma floridae TaxID=7739 RepID=C3Z300_BRAFL|eukprot:XP_002597027.1 hypothetical protein BRAFLDRAFT_96176 [Branchiostoma floridae]